MYSSLKKRANRIHYSVSYEDPMSPLDDKWHEITEDSNKETVANLTKIKETGNKLDETVISNLMSNSVIEDPKPLIPPLKNTATTTDQDRDNYIPPSQFDAARGNSLTRNPRKKTGFSMGNLFMFILVIFSLYCLYKYSIKYKGKSFFGARECISYDISNAYNIVR